LCRWTQARSAVTGSAGVLAETGDDMEFINSPGDENFDPDSPGMYFKTRFDRKRRQLGDDEGFPVLTPELRRRFQNHFDWLELKCQAILKPLKADKWPHRLKDDAPEEAKDAAQLLQHMRGMTRMFEQKKYLEAVLHAYEMGRLHERLLARSWDKDVAHERNRLHAFAADARRRKEQAIERYETLRREHPRTKKYKLVKQISAEEEWSEKSVWGYLRGILP
jgi:hypothetical protein